MPYPHVLIAEKNEDLASPEYKLLNQDQAEKDAILFPSQSAREPLPPLPDKITQDLKERFLKQTNPLGKLYLQRNLISGSKSRLLLAPVAEEMLAAAMIKTACHFYELNFKHRPAVLDDLVKQGYLKEVPLSPYTGKSYGYDSVSGVFWRTGKQGTENGLAPQPKPNEINLGEGIHGIHRLLSAPAEEDD